MVLMRYAVPAVDRHTHKPFVRPGDSGPYCTNRRQSPRALSRPAGEASSDSLVLKAPIRLWSGRVGGTPEQQMERYSRAWVVAAAAGADFTYVIYPDDVHSVDMTVRDDLHAIDFQVKSTALPKHQGDFIAFDLDKTAYDRLRNSNRAGLGVLALVVVDEDRSKWLTFDEEGTHLTWTAYYLCLHGAGPAESIATTRLKVPKANVLTVEAMKTLMAMAEGRWAA